VAQCPTYRDLGETRGFAGAGRSQQREATTVLQPAGRGDRKALRKRSQRGAPRACEVDALGQFLADLLSEFLRDTDLGEFAQHFGHDGRAPGAVVPGELLEL
jgi:hypothetical protein